MNHPNIINFWYNNEIICLIEFYISQFSLSASKYLYQRQAYILIETKKRFGNYFHFIRNRSVWNYPNIHIIYICTLKPNPKRCLIKILFSAFNRICNNSCWCQMEHEHIILVKSEDFNKKLITFSGIAWYYILLYIQDNVHERVIEKCQSFYKANYQYFKIHFSQIFYSFLWRTDSIQ